jgi:hypothetical protein
MTRPLLVVYGNCQAEALTEIFRIPPFAADAFEIRYASSFNPQYPDQPTREELARCVFFFEQYDRAPNPLREMLPSVCKTVTFPSIDCNVLWPWTEVNRANAPEPPDFPHGRFPYGDAVLSRCIDADMSTEEIVEYYFKRAWEEQPVPIERLYALERSRLEAREKHCEVKMGTYIFDRFRDTRMHWTVNHPTSVALCELAIRMMRAAFAQAEDYERSELLFHVRLRLGEPLGQLGVPIHPEVARALGLRRQSGDEKYPYYGAEFTPAEYVRAFVEHAGMRKAELAPAV